MYYFPPHLKNVAALTFENLNKFKFGANQKKMQTKKCHMNQLSFHSYRKTKPCANFEFTSFIVSLINDRHSNS